jgi:hypothetical protein
LRAFILNNDPKVTGIIENLISPVTERVTSKIFSAVQNEGPRPGYVPLNTRQGQWINGATSDAGVIFKKTLKNIDLGSSVSVNWAARHLDLLNCVVFGTWITVLTLGLPAYVTFWGIPPEKSIHALPSLLVGDGFALGTRKGLTFLLKQVQEITQKHIDHLKETPPEKNETQTINYSFLVNSPRPSDREKSTSTIESPPQKKRKTWCGPRLSKILRFIYVD